MGVTLTGVDDLVNDLLGMANVLDTNGNGASVNRALKSGAVMIHSKMLQNASSDPKIITGELIGSIRMSGIKQRAGGGKHITVGVHHQDNAAYYSAPLEFGHGGPAPAPAHPFVRPAFDAEVGAAYDTMREELRNALSRL